MCNLNQLSSTNTWWMKHDLKRMNVLQDIVYWCSDWCSCFHLIKCHISALPPPVTSSLTSDWSISPITRLWLVDPLRSLGSQFQYQGLWSAVTLLSAVARYFIASHPALFRFLTYFRLFTMFTISESAAWCQSRCRPHGAAQSVRGLGGRPGPGRGWSVLTWSLWLITVMIVMIVIVMREWELSSTWAVVTRGLRSQSVRECSVPASVSWSITEKVSGVNVMNYLCHWFNVMLWKSRSSPPTVPLTEEADLKFGWIFSF